MDITFTAYMNDGPVLRGMPADFLVDCCELAPGSVYRSKFMQAVYRSWSAAKGLEPMRKHELLAELRRLGVYSRGGGQVVCRGYRLKGREELQALGMVS